MSGKVTKVDTLHFDETASAYEGYIRQFESLVRDVDQITGAVLDRWKGKGAKAFEKDCRQVKLNLKDIADIMYDLRDALINASAEYQKSDQEVSKAFES